MCITFLYIANEEQATETFPYKFMLTFNRDEDIDRKALPISFWKDDPNILAGKDVYAGGTWLGINVKNGNIAILTNAHSNEELMIKYTTTDCMSRGKITYEFLRSDFYLKRGIEFKKLIDPNVVEDCINQYLESILVDKNHYKGFNLIVGNILTMQFKYTSNKLEDKQIILLSSGCTVLSNDLITLPKPKAIYGIEKFELLIKNAIKDIEYSDKEVMIEELKKIMYDKTKFDISDLKINFPKLYELQKYNYENESSIFVEKYISSNETQRGTKTTSLLFVDFDNKFEFIEIDHHISLIESETKNIGILGKFEEDLM